MRNGSALALGIGLIFLALVVALQSPSAESGEAQPDTARSLATALHYTPAPRIETVLVTQAPVTRIVLAQPSVTPTPRGPAILSIDRAARLMFQGGYDEFSFVSCCGQGMLAPFTDPVSGRHGLALGGAAVLSDGDQDFPAAFASLWLWVDGAYFLEFREVQRVMNPHVAISVLHGKVTFRLTGLDPESGGAFDRMIALPSCRGLMTPVASGAAEIHCY